MTRKFLPLLMVGLLTFSFFAPLGMKGPTKQAEFEPTTKRSSQQISAQRGSGDVTATETPNLVNATQADEMAVFTKKEIEASDTSLDRGQTWQEIPSALKSTTRNDSLQYGSPDPRNIVPESGFEETQDKPASAWGFSGDTYFDDSRSYEGNWSIKFNATDSSNPYNHIEQNVSVSITEDTWYAIGCYVYMDVITPIGNAPSINGNLSFRPYGASAALEVERGWKINLNSSGKWHRIVRWRRIPSNTEKLYVEFETTESGNPTFTFHAWVDNFFVKPVTFLSPSDGSIQNPLTVREGELPKTVTTEAFVCNGTELTSGVDITAKIEGHGRINASESYGSSKYPAFGGDPQADWWIVSLPLPEMEAGLYNITWRAEKGGLQIYHRGKLWVREQKEHYTFAVLSDQHLYHPLYENNINPEQARVFYHWRQTLINVWEITQQINEMGVDFVIINGDYDLSRGSVVRLPTFIDSFDMPVFTTYGNHESQFWTPGETTVPPRSPLGRRWSREP